MKRASGVIWPAAMHWPKKESVRKKEEKEDTVEPRLTDTHNPWIADTPLLRITDSFRGPNCKQAVLNDPDLADTRRTFQQDCPPSLL